MQNSFSFDSDFWRKRIWAFTWLKSLLHFFHLQSELQNFTSLLVLWLFTRTAYQNKMCRPSSGLWVRRVREGWTERGKGTCHCSKEHRSSGASHFALPRAWAHLSTSLCPSFFTCKIRVITGPTAPIWWGLNGLIHEECSEHFLAWVKVTAHIM